MLHLFALFLVILYASPTIKWLLSKSINAFLQWRYAIQHQDRHSSIPSLSFVWANGQGTDKFFHGHSSAQRWRARMGSVYRIWSGFRPEVVLTHPSYLRPYFRNSNHHVKAADNNSGWLFGEVLGSCVGLVSGSRWHALRSELDPFFTRGAATAHTAIIIDAAHKFVSDELPASEPHNEKDSGVRFVNPAQDLQLFPFFVVAGILFGVPLSRNQREALRDLAPLREDLFREVIRGGINRWGLLAQWLGSKGSKMLVEFQTRWLRFVEEAYHLAKEAQKGIDKEEKRGLSKDLPVIKLWDAVLQGRISKRECLQTLDESLYANLDVTTNAVSWNIVLLAQHPKVQSQLRNEIRDMQRTNPKAYARYIDRSDTLLAACVVEAARLRPILPFSNPEASPTDNVTIAGYSIPRNTNVVVDSHAINVANPFWVDGERYIPERHFSLKPEQVRYNLWRFGFGPRQCLGKHFAERILRCVTAEMVGRYELSVSEGKGADEEIGLQEESWVSLPNVVVTCVPSQLHG